MQRFLPYCVRKYLRIALSVSIPVELRAYEVPRHRAGQKLELLRDCSQVTTQNHEPYTMCCMACNPRSLFTRDVHDKPHQQSASQYDIISKSWHSILIFRTVYRSFLVAAMRTHCYLTATKKSRRSESNLFLFVLLLSPFFPLLFSRSLLYEYVSRGLSSGILDSTHWIFLSPWELRGSV